MIGGTKMWRKVSICNIWETQMFAVFFWWTDAGALNDLFSGSGSTFPGRVTWHTPHDHHIRAENRGCCEKNLTWCVRLLTRQISWYLQEKIISKQSYEVGRSVKVALGCSGRDICLPLLDWNKKGIQGSATMTMEGRTIPKFPGALQDKIRAICGSLAC